MNQVAETQQVHPVVRFKRDLSRMIDGKELALPSNVTVEAFRNAAIVAVQDNPAILQCKPETVMKAIRTIAAAGLVPDGREAAIVPFSGAAQAMPMVFGLIKMARRSGDVKDIRAHIVYQNELDQGLFTYVVGDNETLTHTPILFGEKGAPVAVYAIAKLKDGTIVREFMDAAQIEKVRKSSPQQRSSADPKGIWQQWWDEMAKKSVIRRLCKRLDLSAEDMRRVMVEEDAPLRDVTPALKEHIPLSQRLADAKGEAIDADGVVQEPDDDPAPAEDQSQESDSRDQDPNTHWTDHVDAKDGAPGTGEWNDGMDAFKQGAPVTDCPHEDDMEAAQDWIGGWYSGKKVAK